LERELEQELELVIVRQWAAHTYHAEMKWQSFRGITPNTTRR